MNPNFMKLMSHIYDEVNMCSKEFTTPDGVSVTFFPKIYKAFIQDGFRTFWYDAAGVGHALEQYYWNDNKDLSY